MRNQATKGLPIRWVRHQTRLAERNAEGSQPVSDRFRVPAALVHLSLGRAAPPGGVVLLSQLPVKNHLDAAFAVHLDSSEAPSGKIQELTANLQKSTPGARFRRRHAIVNSFPEASHPAIARQMLSRVYRRLVRDWNFA